VEARQQKRPVPCDGCGQGIEWGAIQCKWCPFGNAARGRAFHLGCAKAGAGQCAPLDRAHLRRHGRLSKRELEQLHAILDGSAGLGDTTPPQDTLEGEKEAADMSMGRKHLKKQSVKEKDLAGSTGGQSPCHAKKKAKTYAGTAESREALPGQTLEDQAGQAPEGKSSGRVVAKAGSRGAQIPLGAATPEKISAPTKKEMADAKAGSTGASQLGKAQKARVTDVASDPTVMLPPILGVCDVPRQSLANAAIATGVPGMDACGFLASETGSRLAQDDPHGLDEDEAGALNLYTMESRLYPELNSRLRDCDRKKLKQFFPFLKLMLSAKAKLPKYVGTVWRGVKLDLRKLYRKGDEVYWWAFSSTTKSLSTLTNPQFLGKKGTRTIFNVQVKSGLDISAYSVYKDAEAEVLMFPGCKLRVVDTLDMGNKLVMVHLEEVELPVVIMK